MVAVAEKCLNICQVYLQMQLIFLCLQNFCYNAVPITFPFALQYQNNSQLQISKNVELVLI